MAEKKRTQPNKGGSAPRRKGEPAGKKSQTSTRAQAAQNQEDPSPIPATIIAGIIMGAAALVLLAALFGMNGAIFALLGDIFRGLFGRIGFGVLPFACMWITLLLFFPIRRKRIWRCLCVFFSVLCVSAISQVFYNAAVTWGFSMFQDLYFGGIEGTAAGVLGGILGGVFELGLGKGGTVIAMVVILLLCLLSASNMPIGSLIRAYRNRPRPEPLEPEEEKEEPATVLVNHLAQKHIERVERKRQISDFDLPIDDPIYAGEQQDFLAQPLPPEKKEKKRKKAQEASAPASDSAPEQETAPASTQDSAFETFDGAPITGDTVILNGHHGAQPENTASAPEEDTKELPFDLGEFPPLHPAQESASEENTDSAPVEDSSIDAPEDTDEQEPADLEPVPEELPPSRIKPEETKQEAEKIDQEVARQAAVPASEYCFPPLDLLKNPQVGQTDSTEEMRRNSQLLKETLESFKIDAQICNVTRGPSVTRYELKIDMGVRLARVTALADDIALALGATGVRIAAVPNKQSVVGIEVPNEKVTMVPIRDVISSSAFVRAKSKTSFALGKDISGNCVIGDIASLPHLLIAGTTGSGKSVCMNSIIISFLYKARPDEVKLIMVDPKMVELGVYNGIPHLLIPVVTDPKKAAGALQWAVTEMLRRYRLMRDLGAREIEGYNHLIEESGEGEKLPKIVVIIDELADLMMVAAKEVEESICRIAQMGRAAGMHLIIATQRPSANIITGVMKANIPSRIAFAVSSAMESRIILDAVGAEKLVGKGDMLYAPVGNRKPRRVQGCFISDGEVESAAEYVKTHFMASYSQDVMDEIDRKAEQEAEKAAGAATDDVTDGGDELLPAAVDVILETGQASVSMLQRRLKLGYARAARIVDEMEDRGIVGPFVGSKPREILITKDQWAQMQSGVPQQMEMEDPGPVPDEIP